MVGFTCVLFPVGTKPQPPGDSGPCRDAPQLTRQPSRLRHKGSPRASEVSQAGGGTFVEVEAAETR